MSVDCNLAATEDGYDASRDGWRNVQKKIKTYEKSERFKDAVGYVIHEQVHM